MKRSSAAVIVGCLCLTFGAALPATATRILPARKSLHWVGAWEAPPSDASQGSTVLDKYDFSLHPKSPVDDATVRATFSPTFYGPVARVHLSNRFGAKPVTFERATIARVASGAAIIRGSLRGFTFHGKTGVTVAAGNDVVSDPVRFPVRAFQTLAVSVYVPGDAGKPTEHSLGRQNSYVTAANAGDATRNVNGRAFTVATTSRPFVTGLDVRSPESAGAVVTLGDSLTDGDQNQPAGFPESPRGIGKNVRYPDWLARRLLAGHIPLSVLNAGIGGNKLLHPGAYGGNFDVYGPSALQRLRRDVLDQAGVTTVIMLLGINDASQNPRATPAQIITAYKTIISRIHRAGLRVLQGRLTPFEGYPLSLSFQAQEEATREAVNRWIRTQSPADAIVDFDRAVRDPSDPLRLNPAYDDGEHLHLSAAAYRRMARAVPMKQLRLARCT